MIESVDSLHERRTIFSKVTGAPDSKMEFGSTVFASQSIVTTYSRVDGAPWEVSYVKVGGGQRLKNDEISTRRLLDSGYANPLRESPYNACPEWLREFAAQWLEQFNAEGVQS
jgi:hypothetical protein